MDSLLPLPAREQLSFGFPRSPVPGSRRLRVRAGAPRAARQARIQRGVPQDVRQAALPLGHPIDELARLRLERRIGAHLRGELRVVVTDNRYSILSVRRGRGTYEARLHHMFLGADPKVVRALARYIARNDPGASTLINEYIEQNQRLIRLSLPAQPRAAKLQPLGRYFDLQAIFDELNEEHFQGRIRAQITWGRRTGGRAKRHRSVKMGSYSLEEQLIRINPALDRAFVPRFFVEYIVFHEMLHQVHEIPVVNGRHHYHTPSFTAHERSFPAYPAARRWELENLSRLLHY